MSTFDPNFNLEYDWAFRESGWKDGMDSNLLKIGSVIQLSVLSRSTDIPATPSEGDRYIIPANATGDWTGKDDQIAVYVNASWVYYAPVVGWWCYVEDSEERVQYISVGWSVFAGSGGSSELEVSTEAVTAYTLVAADAGKYLRMDHADPNTVTVPDDATLDFPVGTQVHVRQAGAGQTSVAGATGVTINTAETLSLNKQHSTATLVKVAADTWDLMGDLEASA